MSLLKASLTTALFFLLLSTATYAQTPSFSDITGTRNNSVNLIVNPSYPSPGDQVQVTVEGVLIDVRGADISWSLNDKIVERGTGKTSFTFNVGDVGSTQVVEVAVIPESGGISLDSIVIRPVDIDLLWEADSFVPPFYRGKALRAPQSPARVIALPRVADSSGNLIPKESLIYTWRFNDKVMGNASGFGRFMFANDLSPHENTIGVEVSFQDGTLIAQKEVLVVNADPELLFYIQDPLFGVLLEQPLGSIYNFREKEITFIGYPYFLAMQNVEYEYDWRINNSKVDAGVDLTNSLTLGRQEDNKSKSRISLVINHPRKAFQRVFREVQLVFEE